MKSIDDASINLKSSASAKNRLVIYKAVFGGYDKVSSVPVNSWGCDFFCFTDNSKFSAEGWTVIYVPSGGLNSPALNRQYKMLPHRYFKEYSCSLYIDGNIDLVGDPRPLITDYLTANKIAIPSHPKRNCSYDEAAHCIKSGLSSVELTQRQMNCYAGEGFPRQAGLTENGVILRIHNDPEVLQLMESWWIEYCSKVKRDQISLHYLAWKQGIKIAQIKDGPRVNNKYFHIGLHDSDNQTSWYRRIARYAHGNQNRRWIYALITKIVNLSLRVSIFIKSRN